MRNLSKNVLSTLLFCFLLNSCSNNKDGSSDHIPMGKKEDTSKQTTSGILKDSINSATGDTVLKKPEKPLLFDLVSKKLPDMEGETPQCEVYLSVDGALKKIKVINSCTTIEKAAYKEYQIPTDAITALGGWWAGGGEYYYLIIKEGKPVVYYGWQDEGQVDKGYHWKPITVK